MKNIHTILYLLGFIIISSCKNSTDSTKNHNDNDTISIASKIDQCFVNSDLTSIKKTEFYKNSNKIEIRSYVRSFLGDIEPEPENHTPVNRSNNPIDNYDESVFLNETQKDSLFALLNGFTNGPGFAPADCYFPRHRIHFYDNNEKLIGFIEICFECNDTKSDIKLFKHVCNDQLDYYKNFVKWCGITKGFK